MSELTPLIRLERLEDHENVENLISRVFGPGRFTRTAERLRERGKRADELCYVAFIGTYLAGSIRLSHLRINLDRPALLLGPITIDPIFQRRGIGSALMDKVLELAKAEHKLIILIGEPNYYQRYGFKVVPKGTLKLPTPENPARVQYLELEAGAFEGVTGVLRPWPV